LLLLRPPSVVASSCSSSSCFFLSFFRVPLLDHAGFLVLGVITTPFKLLSTAVFGVLFNLPGVAQVVRHVEVALEVVSFPYYQEEDPVEVDLHGEQPYNDPKIVVRTLYGLLVGWLCMDPILCLGKLCLSSVTACTLEQGMNGQ
jgi:hypothetical protein